MRAIYVDGRETIRAIYDRVGQPILPDLVIHMGDPLPEDLADLMRGYRGVLNGHTYMPRVLLERCADLEVIVFLGTGVASYVDMDAAADLGIGVFGIPGCGSRTIAEHTIALMFAAVRRIAIQDRKLREGIWHREGGFEIAGKTLGVIGLGSVGREVAKLGSALGMRVIGWSRGGVPPGVPCALVTLDELLSQSDVVTVHIAHLPETEGFIGGEELSRMPPHAVLINTARGALVDENALARALREGRIAHAALDVYAHEPLAEDHPFTRLDNVTLTAHSAWNSPEASERLVVWSLEKLRDELRLRAK